MDAAAVLDRINQRLTEIGRTADAVSRAAGKPDAIRNLRRAVKEGKRQGVTMATLAALAAEMHTTVAWLAGDEASPVGASSVHPNKKPRSIPVVGKVAAGVFREVIELDDEEPEYIFDEPDPEFPNARQIAFTVEGDSLNALEPRPVLDGDSLICVDFDDTGLPLVDGMLVVIERSKDGGHSREWSAKQVEIHEDRTEFHPRSRNKNHKPIILFDDPDADTGEKIEVIALVRRSSYAMPRHALGRRR